LDNNPIDNANPTTRAIFRIWFTERTPVFNLNFPDPTILRVPPASWLV